MKPHLFILLLLLVGCGSYSSRTEDVKLHEGTDGVLLSFGQEGFPEEILEGQKIGATFMLENKGAYSISQDLPGMLIVTTEQDLLLLKSLDGAPGMQVSGNTLLFPLRGKTLGQINGEKSRVRANFEAKMLSGGLNKIDSRILASVCYPYRTQLEEQICIDPDPSESQIKKGCVAESLEGTSQGAPITITNVEQRTLVGNNPDDMVIQFTVTAENAGNGVLLSDEEYAQVCLGRDPTKKAGIYVRKFAFSDFSYLENKGGDIECAPQPMQEVDSGYVTRCQLTSGIPKSTPAFMTPLSIELGYGYKETIAQDLIVLSANPDMN